MEWKELVENKKWILQDDFNDYALLTVQKSQKGCYIVALKDAYSKIIYNLARMPNRASALKCVGAFMSAIHEVYFLNTFIDQIK